MLPMARVDNLPCVKYSNRGAVGDKADSGSRNKKIEYHI